MVITAARFVVDNAIRISDRLSSRILRIIGLLRILGVLGLVRFFSTTKRINFLSYFSNYLLVELD